MLKKINLLLSLLFCSNIIFTAQEPLTQQELTIYHSLSSLYKPNPNINSVRKKYNISYRDLYDILIKQKNLLLSKDPSLSMFLQNPYISITDGKINTFVKDFLKEGYVAGQLNKYFLIGLSIIGMPTLATGLATKPSDAILAPGQQLISSGLIGIGSMLSAPAILIGAAKAAGKFEEFLRSIIYSQKIKHLNELKDINHFLDILETRYLK